MGLAAKQRIQKPAPKEPLVPPAHVGIGGTSGLLGTAVWMVVQLLRDSFGLLQLRRMGEEYPLTLSLPFRAHSTEDHDRLSI